MFLKCKTTTRNGVIVDSLVDLGSIENVNRDPETGMALMFIKGGGMFMPELSFEQVEASLRSDGQVLDVLFEKEEDND